MVLKQKQVLIYAGIGLVVSGIATIFLIYQGLNASDAADIPDVADQQSDRFQLEEVPEVP